MRACVVLLDVAKFLSTASCYIFIENYRLLLAKRKKREKKKGKALECFFEAVSLEEISIEIYLLKRNADESARRDDFPSRTKENKEIKKKKKKGNVKERERT